VKSDFKFAFSLRVRFSETDAQGVVFNGAYFTYLDVGITEYQRHLGFPWREMVRTGFDFVIARVTFEYRVPAQYDDLVAVHVRTSRIGDRSLTLDAEMYRGDSDTLLTLGCLVHVAIDPETKQSIPIPAAYRERVVAFEGL
jgi:acyl-CoA thioester hydrolase